jgi:hypothetical protein
MGNIIMRYNEITNFDNNPILKQLLVNYILREYEEDSIIDENHLMMEYNRLRDSNQLDMIFMCEELINREQNN